MNCRAKFRNCAYVFWELVYALQWECAIENVWSMHRRLGNLSPAVGIRTGEFGGEGGRWAWVRVDSGKCSKFRCNLQRTYYNDGVDDGNCEMY